MSGIESYGIRRRSAKAGGKFGSYSTDAHNTPATSRKADLKAGHTTCFSVRARDRAGHVSAWSAERCYSRPA